MQATEALFAMVAILSFFGSIFGIFYLRARVNLAMIDKGYNPRQHTAQPKPFVNLKFGLLFLGAGLGLISAYMMDTVALGHKQVTEHYTTDSTGRILYGNMAGRNVRESTTSYGETIAMSSTDGNGVHTHTRINDEREPVIYFAMIAIGGGLGLILSYRIEKKQWLDKKENIPA